MVKTTAVSIFLLFFAGVAHGQETLRDAVTSLMTNQGVQTSDLERDRAAAEAAGDAVTRALLVNLTSAPIATSSSSFVYRLNPELGTVERATTTYGTLFVERALTAGAGNVSFGMSAWTAGYDRLNGQNLRDGSFVTIANRFRDESEPFDTEAVAMELRASTIGFFGNVGVTDHLDIGVIVPLTRVSLDGQRINVYRGTSAVQVVTTGNSSGFGDVALRAKYSLFSARSGGVAAAGELRLPTGDEDNLLGAGSTSWRIFGVASFESPALSAHANAGIVRGGLSNETFMAGAISAAVHPRASVTGELVRRTVSSLGGFTFASAPHPTVGGVDTFRLLEVDESSSLWTLVTGVKWNASDTIVVGGHLLWSVGDRGLTARVTPTIAVEYSLR